MLSWAWRGLPVGSRCPSGSLIGRGCRSIATKARTGSSVERSPQIVQRCRFIVLRDDYVSKLGHNGDAIGLHEDRPAVTNLDDSRHRRGQTRSMDEKNRTHESTLHVLFGECEEKANDVRPGGQVWARKR